MNLARVTGSVWMTQRHPAFEGKKLLTVQPETPEGRPLGAPSVAVDVVDAGIGDRVLLMEEGNGSRQLMGDLAAPIRGVIVGVVDGVDLPPVID